MKSKEKSSKFGFIFFLIVVCLFFAKTCKNIFSNISNDVDYNPKSLNILSSYENEPMESNIKKYAKKNGITISFKYMGDLDIVDELNSNSKEYDAIWISNSMWLYMLDNTYLTSDSKSVSISPVVFGITKSKANELGLMNKSITNNDILKLIQDKKIKYVMSSVTRTNTGATAYFGFLNTLAGNPEVLTTDMLNNKKLKSDLKTIFSGVERVSGDEDYLKEMFLNDSDYEAVIADESSLININKELKSKKKEQLYLIYPTDGVAINDSTFAFIDNGQEKEEKFLKIQSYLLSDEGQKVLGETGKRTWYGGVNKNPDKSIFNPDWGIDTTKYLNVTRFPSKSVMTAALNMYIELLRKPTHVVFCLDYSGSMYGEGIESLTEAMNYILDRNKASLDKLQFSENDKITVITFSSHVTNVWTTDNGYKTEELINNINKFNPEGSTALYDAIIKGLSVLKNESDDYTKTIIAMTDGVVNVGTFSGLKAAYQKQNQKIPIYSITFGSANERQLKQIAELSNAKVFDGKSGLLKAFKEVRGYN